MWNILDPNCKATDGIGAPELIHGLWYRYCNDCGVYHATDSDAPAAVKPASVLPFRRGTSPITA